MDIMSSCLVLKKGIGKSCPMENKRTFAQAIVEILTFLATAQTLKVTKCKGCRWNMAVVEVFRLRIIWEPDI